MNPHSKIRGSGLWGWFGWVINYAFFRDPRQDMAKETAAAGASRRRDGFRKWIMEYLKKLLVTFFSPTMMILLVAGEFTVYKTTFTWPSMLITYQSRV